SSSPSARPPSLVRQPSSSASSSRPPASSSEPVSFSPWPWALPSALILLLRREHPVLVLHDLSRDGRSGDRQRRGEVQPARAGATLVVAIDRRHGRLIAALGDAGSAADARTAARLDPVHAAAPEHLGEALLLADPA